MDVDRSLDALLAMDGSVGEIGGGWWYKIEARPVAASSERPFGVKYSLTLHTPSGERVFGIDNAHPVTEGGGPGRRRRLEWDHKHRSGRVVIYEYVSAADLLADFFETVDWIMASGDRPS